ncbi:hypothetical protein ACFQ8T_05885 [Isoptericola sp. NPDC056618]|uniref:hypothetical protein n=1 Tax=Isoptericola sp. NPDC056618 TaxID=3345878 RepID=UPI0036756024
MSVLRYVRGLLVGRHLGDPARRSTSSTPPPPGRRGSPRSPSTSWRACGTPRRARGYGWPVRG